MKSIIQFVTLLILISGLAVSAQEVTLKGATYSVKGDVVLKDGVDVTNILSLEERLEIKTALDKKAEAKKVAKKRENELKKAEKEQKNAEKKQERAEKALRQKEKLHTNFGKASEKYEAALKKYEKLKKKGKLSPQDEEKWLSKIQKLKEKSEKAKRKL